MRVIVSCLIAAALFAGSAAAETLAPGRPAGVRQAAGRGNLPLAMGVGAVVMAGVGVLISGGSSALASNPISGGEQVGPSVSNSTIIVTSSSTGS